MADADADWVGGFHAVEVRLKSGEALEVNLDRGRRDRRARQLEDLAARYEVPVRRVAGTALDQHLPGVKHQGVAAQIAATAAVDHDWRDCIAGVALPLILVLDEVEDPRNLGACMRAAEGAGAHCVIVPKRRSAGLNPAARKTAAGAAESLPLVVVSNLARTLQAMQAEGLWLLGLADGEAPSLYSQDLRRPLALVLGNEGTGLRRLTGEHCDALASLPMAGQVSSLNVSVAAGISLYEAVRQRELRVDVKSGVA